MPRHLRLTRRDRQSGPYTRRVPTWLRHPLVIGLVLVAAGAAPAAYLPSDASGGGVFRTARLAPGDTVAIYGPQQFAGSGGNGTTYVERFTVALVPGRQYLVRLDNGTSGGANRATSAVTTLNGAEVVSAADLTTSIASVTQVVSVREVDTLRITVKGSAGSVVTATVSAAATAEFAVSGPTDYGVPAGTTKTYTFSFDKPAGAGPPFRLYLANGDSAGAGRVTNASVTLNGTAVVGTNEFTKSVGSLTKPVTLSATNNLTIALKGSALTFATLTLTATDTAAPVVTISSPAAEAVTGTSPVTVSGTVSDQSPTGVTVNGVAASVTGDTTYTATVPLTSQGTNTLTVVATDAGGRSSQATRSIVFDTEPPALAVSAPADNAAMREASVTVTATATDVTALTVNTNGTPLTPGSGSSYSGSVALALGANVLTTTATDAAGNATSVVRTVTRDTTPPVLTVTSPAEGTTTAADSIDVSGTASDETALSVTVNGSAAPVSNGTFSARAALAAGSNTITVAASDAAGNATTITRTVTRDTPLPPDPSTLATTIDPTAINTVSASTAFLYSGGDPVQTGVAAGTIKALQAAVIRGRVVDTAGAVLSGVQIAILSHPELGQTQSRADGHFDLAVNGGDELTVSFGKGGLLPAQRTLSVPWENFVDAGDVALTPLDPQVTTVTFQQPAEVARGSVVTDSAGTRQATVIFEQGTQATMVLPNGSTQPLGSIHVRATEYTRGAQGLTAMPAPLPVTSAYTYAMELSVDEALAAGARSVQFSAPVSFYVENFLRIPTGARVPFGTYDRQTARWVPEKSGRVVRILSTSPVQIAASYPDTTTSASQALLDTLGVSAAELSRLGSLYAVGTTLWRVEVSHFTPGDLNFAFGWPAKVFAPLVSILRPKLSCQQTTGGSIIGCEGQTLGEDIGLAGTPLTLHYQSDRTLGYGPEREIEIPAQTRVDTSLLTTARRLKPNEFPSHAMSISYVLQVAGKTIGETRSPTGIVSGTTLRWDGRDVYGRVVNGAAKAKLSIGFEYPNTYAISTSGGGGGGGFGAPPEAGSIAFIGRRSGVLQQVWEGTIGSWDNRAGFALGGWSLSAQHVYDPTSGTLYLGSGERRAAATLGNVARIIPATRGTFCGATNCGTPIRTRFALGHLAVDGAGRVVLPYLQDGAGPSAPGIIRILGTAGNFVDSIPNAGNPRGVAIAPDGTLYFSDQFAHVVRRRTPDGTTVVLAGTTGSAGFLGDGGPATSAKLNNPGAIALGLDGSLFIADGNNSRIRRVAPDGTISTYAGTGGTSFVADGALATATPTPTLGGLAVAADGTVIFSASNLVRRIDAAGRVSTVAGYFLPNGPGPTPATSLFFNTAIGSVAAEPDGGVLFSFPGRVYRATPAGTLETVAGRGIGATGSTRCVALIQAVVCDPRDPADQEIASQTGLEGVVSLGVGPDRTIYLAESSGSIAFVRAIRPGLPGLSASTMLVTSEDGGEVYEFSSTGRHLRTRNGYTGKTLAVFDYDGAGRLVALRDSLGNTTTIERDGTGTPLAVVAPFGQRTTLTLDANGYLQEVQDPGGNRVRLTHSAEGLLTELRDPRDKVHRFAYDEVGRLAADSAPDGSAKTLVRTARDSGYTVALSTVLGRTTSYSVEAIGSGVELRTVTDPAGLLTRTYRGSGAVDSTRMPDGTRLVLTRNGDPRFGAQVTFPGRMVVRLPSNDSSVVVSRRASIRSDSTNPFTLTQQIDSTTVNGNLWRTVYAAAGQVTTRTSPEGRQAFVTQDSLGRVRVVRTPGLDSVVHRYDSRGRLDQVKVGGRMAVYTYDTKGRLATTTDPLGRTDSLFYDGADRLIRQVLPGGREVQFAYDSSGNLTSLTPPGRPAHGFTPNAVDLESLYSPPAPAGGSWATEYRYNADRQLTEVRRPDGITVGFGYDATTGRPGAATFDRGTLSFGYSATTGQLTSLTAPGGANLAFTYDGMLPKTATWSGPVAGSVGMSYNSDFRVTKQAVNGTDTVSFAYDRDGLLTTAGALGLKRSAQTGFLERDSAGTVLGVWAYDPKGALASYAASAGGTALFQASYVRDSLSRITQLTEMVQGATRVIAFTYDSAGRLETVRRDGTLAASYRYDGNGNRLDVTTPNGVVTGGYDAQDRLTSYGTATYAYTANGELREKVVGTDTTRYAYDALGNLVHVRLPAGTVIDYVIDGQNRRIGKKVDGVLVQGLLYQSQLAPVAELDGAGQVVSRFVYATRGNVPDYLVKGGQTYRLVLDHLGSVRLVMNAADGTVVQRIDYDEFGQVTQNTNPGYQPFGYAGGLRDEQTGLVRFGRRDYDPTTGRWTAKDPVGFKGGQANLYTYALGNPVRYLDPDGLDIWVEGASCDELHCEPAGHLSVNVGDPFGVYKSYSFGINGHGLEGEVYRDVTLGGEIEADMYLRTTAEQDKRAQESLEGLLGQTSTYFFNNTCRNFSIDQFFALMRRLKVEPSVAPVRPRQPNAPGRWPRFPSSTSFTDPWSP
jgi:RHS repeat-associated protein